MTKESNDRKPSVLIQYREMSPYRLKLFEILGATFDLDVYFCEEVSDMRRWETDIEKYDIEYSCGNGVNILGVNFNKELLKKCSLGRDVIVISGMNEKNVFSLLMAIFIGKVKGSKIVLWSGFVQSQWHLKNRTVKNILGRIIRYIIAKTSDCCVLYGPETEKYFRQMGVKEEKLYEGTQYLPEDYLCNTNGRVPKVLRQHTGSDIVLYLGYFKEEKGIKYLIDAFKMADLKDAVLVLAGDGPLYDEISKQYSQDKNIVFPGYVDGPSKAWYYHESDLFVLPSLYEPWGLVVNEAMYHGLPVVVTESVGSKCLIKENGKIVEPEDQYELKVAIEKVLSDKGKHSYMSKQSEKIISERCLQDAVKTFRSAILSAISS
ncbi:glycosyltransferase family 4 protein [Salinibacter sp.]|uniref:glycosyltransferase family 4 protein n=1 Tax=Salinibacter sp. TaxID=2065818 RepID=UPI0021E8B243|nr:glycosyltransferase family 4 protein [Salinibacter sp.]